MSTRIFPVAPKMRTTYCALRPRMYTLPDVAVPTEEKLAMFEAHPASIPSVTFTPDATLFITGDGDVTPTLATGATPSSGTPANRLPHPRLPVTVTVGGSPAPVVFTGVPAGLAGVTQVNFTIPKDAQSGLKQVVVTVGGVSSPPVFLTVP